MNKTKEGMADIHTVIRKILREAGKALKAWQIQAQLLIELGRRYSESAVTARLREMKDVCCNLSNYTYDIA